MQPNIEGYHTCHFDKNVGKLEFPTMHISSFPFEARKDKIQPSNIGIYIINFL